jgi:hypothetical protein
MNKNGLVTTARSGEESYFIRLIKRTNSTLIQSDPRLCRYTVVVAPLAVHG